MNEKKAERRRRLLVDVVDSLSDGTIDNDEADGILRALARDLRAASPLLPPHVRVFAVVASHSIETLADNLGRS